MVNFIFVKFEQKVLFLAVEIDFAKPCPGSRPEFKDIVTSLVVTLLFSLDFFKFILHIVITY